MTRSLAITLIIDFIEGRFEGSAAIIDATLKVLDDEHDAIVASLTALEKYVPGSTPFLEILKGLLEEVVAKTVSPKPQ